MTERTKASARGWWGRASGKDRLAVVLVTVGALAYFGAMAVPDAPVGSVDAQNEPAPVVQPAPDPDPEPELELEPVETVAQQNAVSEAENYLAFTSFSRKGLVEQLEYEGYATADARYAVRHIEVDWYEQAALKAQDYLDFTSFSRQGLVDQLEHDGFTFEQAVYGVDQTGL